MIRWIWFRLWVPFLKEQLTVLLLQTSCLFRSCKGASVFIIVSMKVSHFAYKLQSAIELRLNSWSQSSWRVPRMICAKNLSAAFSPVLSCFLTSMNACSTEELPRTKMNCDCFHCVCVSPWATKRPSTLEGSLREVIALGPKHKDTTCFPGATIIV